MKKPGRNDPCPCGSGKKFKKCCESTMLGGRFKATKIESSPQAAATKMAGLFRSHVAPPVTHSPKPIKAVPKPAQDANPPENPSDAEGKSGH